VKPVQRAGFTTKHTNHTNSTPDSKEKRRTDRGNLPGTARRRLSGSALYLLLLGLFLGLSIVKFGNPVILDQKIIAPTTLREVWSYAWPTHWAYWLLVPLALAGAGVALAGRPRWPGTRWLWVLPLLWFVWQLAAAGHSVDARLTAAVLWHFGGCLACYFAGALVSGEQRVLRWLLIGVLAAFTFSLVRAVNQRLFEFPQERRLLLEGEQCGWTNFPPAMVLEMKQNSIIITTNGMDIANPDVLVRYAKRRVMGTLVYANALAGAVLLLWPVSFAIACNSTRRFRPATRVIVIALTVFLGGAGLFWTGSKLGWLIALALLGLWLLRRDWPKRWKYALLAFALVAGLGVFVVRFHHYFATGATSVGARLDYWRAAVQITRAHPLFGSGPGTFQRPYASLKAPEAEMARLTHNDYLEQFSDSGIVGGVSYTLWIVLALALAGRRAWRSGDPLLLALYLGVLGWFLQGLGEFSLYVPALAWTAFTLLGWLVAATGNRIDKAPASH
jgi:O-Antigen ligase